MGQAAREMTQKYRNTLDSPTKAKYATSTKFDNVAWNGVTVFEFDRILYAVGANKEPLARLFFCKYCLELRAENSDCVQTEIDSHFCMHALDNVPTTEAILKQNKSRSYWQCPCCPSILNHKTQQTKIQNGDQEIVKKLHFMRCAFCYWSTKDVGMEDTPAAGAWPERENQHSTRVAEVVEYVKAVSSNAAFLARAKMNKRISTRVTGKMAGLSPLLSMNLSMKDGKPAKVNELTNPSSLRLEDLPPLDEQFNSDEGIDYASVTSLEAGISIMRTSCYSIETILSMCLIRTCPSSRDK